jgi:SAM-dependent methyltransferase
MERAEWLKQMREMTEALYDHVSPAYWSKFGLYENKAHQEYLQKFTGRIARGGTILSAACGAGRYDGMLLEAGHNVIGIDQSAGMLRRAKEHFPAARYEKMGLQEIDFLEAFDGAICMDALEHICPEDWPGILKRLREVLKPDGLLYFTVEVPDEGEVQASYERAKTMGLPVVLGELADEVEASYEKVKADDPQGMPGELEDVMVYHYYPSQDQVKEWVEQAGLVIEEKGTGNGYDHYLVRRD